MDFHLMQGFMGPVLGQFSPRVLVSCMSPVLERETGPAHVCVCVCKGSRVSSRLEEALQENL